MSTLPQMSETMSANKAMARVATALDLSNVQAVKYLDVHVRNGRLAVFGRKLLPDGSEQVGQIEGGRVRLTLNKDGRIYLLMGRITRHDIQPLFRQEDIDRLWPPVEKGET